MNSTPPIPLCLTQLVDPVDKVPASDVAQPSVVELAWFNAAGTSEGYCA